MTEKYIFYDILKIVSINFGKYSTIICCMQKKKKKTQNKHKTKQKLKISKTE